jgi:hypothetical protein
MPSLYQRSRRIINGQMLSRFLLIGTVVLLQACSAIKLAYNNAPEFGFWWLDAYADFNDTQAPAVRAELARLLQWHRNEELPKIAELLQKTKRLAAADVTPAAVCDLFAETRVRFNAVTSQAENATASLAMSLTPAQIVHMEGKLAKNNKEWRNDWLQLSGKELFEKRLKANVERAQEFYGTLEERQLTALRGALESSSYDAQLSYTERQRRQQDLLQTLRQTTGAGPGSGTTVAATSRSPADGLAALRGYLDRTNKSPNPVYRAYSDKLTAESCASFATLHNSTTPEQRERAVRRLAAYERDARDLYSQR